jgi:hypothetical protein
MHKTQEVILGKPFSNKGKTQQPFAIFPREETLSTKIWVPTKVALKTKP